MEITGDTYGGTCAIGWTDPGEWVEYNISVPKGGLYHLVVRTASENPNVTLHLELDGYRITGPIQGSGLGWQNYVDRFIPDVPFTEGDHKVRVVFDTGSINLNYLVVFQDS